MLLCGVLFGLCFRPAAFAFFAGVCYDLKSARWWWLAISALPVFTTLLQGQFYIGIFGALLISVSMLMSYRTGTIEKSKREYIELRDSAKETAIKVEEKNKEFLQKQDYEINLATLTERNRIARDIHDSVGHLLSSAILQIGALMATSKDEAEKERLETVKNTLTQGMDSIRTSVHDLYDESVDLYTEVRGVTSGFNYCPVTLEYDIPGSPDKKIKYALIAIIKESLANIARHSGATAANITLREQPAFYTLSISDNGRGMASPQESSGIGLKNIADRVEDMGGILNINGENGFKIYISVPKGR